MKLFVGGKFQGMYECAEKSDCKNIWNDFQDYVRSCVEENISLEAIKNNVREKISLEKIDAVVCTELGCGIVPVNREDRDWREYTGRLLCMLACEADCVFRVTCGIAVRIK